MIAANAVAGVVALGAWWLPRLRGRWVWALTILAEGALALEVVLGAVLVASDRYSVAQFHMFYGFVGFLTIGLAYQYRDSFRGGADTPRWRRIEFFYGLVGLFLMGVGIRAVVRVTA